MVLITLIISLLFAGFAFAQDNTVSLFIPGADIQTLVGSIVASDKSATTYALQCAPGSDSDDCGFPGIFTLTEGPSTAFYALSGDVEDSTGTVLAFTANFNCTLASFPSPTAICRESFGGLQANFPGTTTEIYTGTEFFRMPVVITATATPVSTSSSTNTKTDGMASVTDSGSAASRTLSGSGVSGTGNGAEISSAKATSTSTGGVPVVTGGGWVVGGAVMLAALL